MCQIVHPCDKLFDSVDKTEYCCIPFIPAETHSIYRWTPNTWSVLIHSYICLCSSCRLLTSRQDNIIQRVTIKYKAKFGFLKVLFTNIHYFSTLRKVSICKQQRCGSDGKDRCILGLKEIRLTTNKHWFPKILNSLSCLFTKNILSQKFFLIFHATLLLKKYIQFCFFSLFFFHSLVCFNCCTREMCER